MGPIGIPEMMAIVLIALLLFGPKKLPELGRMLGKGLTEFRRMKNEFSRTFETHMRELEREARLSEIQSSSHSVTSPSNYSSTSYSYPYEDTHTDGVPAIEPPAEPASELVAPYEPPVPATPVNGTVARSAQSLNGSEAHYSAPAPSEAIATQAEAGEEHRV